MQAKLKTCKDCGKTMPIEQFGRKGYTPAGRIHWSRYCAPCYKKRRDARNLRYRTENREKSIAYSAAYRNARRSPDVDKRKKQKQASAGHKVCRTCFYEMLASEFQACSRSKDGLKPNCKKCRAVKSKADHKKRYKQAIKQGICAQCRKRPPVTKVFCQECNDRINRINADRLAERKAKGLCTSCGIPALKGYRLCVQCNDRRRVKAKVVYHQTKERDRERIRKSQYLSKQRRRIREQSVAVHEEIDRAVVIARDNSTCYICKEVVPKNRIHLDHVVPLSRGGSHIYDNVRVTCKDCNLRKNNKLPEEIGIIVPPLHTVCS